MTTAAGVATQIYTGPGFRSFGLDLAVKFGGSLLFDTTSARGIAESLEEVAQTHKLAIIPGGGPTDKLIEKLARETALRSDQINPACMRAMDQTGILLSHLAPAFRQAESFRAVRATLDEGATPVLLPSQIVLSLDVFVRHDVITSDTIGAYLAFLLGAPRYVVLTDVDGIHEKLVEGSPVGAPIPSLTVDDLASMGHTSVDRCLAPFLQAVGLPAQVMNGRSADLARALRGEIRAGTMIQP